jgi:hypothetical protein
LTLEYAVSADEKKADNSIKEPNKRIESSGISFKKFHSPELLFILTFLKLHFYFSPGQVE